MNLMVASRIIIRKMQQKWQQTQGTSYKILKN